jgi:signal transduction histidine kinase
MISWDSLHALKIDIDWMNLKIATLESAAQKRVTHANKTIEVLISSIRKIASRLRPGILDDFGLNAALQWHCTEFEGMSGITCLFETEINDQDLSIELKTALFRITQESLTHVMRHSKATHVEVIIKEDAQNIYLSIADDGTGFDASVHKNTLGLIGLRERAVALTGAFRIASEVGKGTIVIASIPKK